MCAKKIVQWRWNYYIVKGMLPKESEFLGSCCNNILSLSSMMNDVIIKTKLGRSSTCTFTMQWQWPESSALGNAADFCLATLPMALPPKKFLLKIA